MPPRLPITAAPGSATSTRVIRAGQPLDTPPSRDRAPAQRKRSIPPSRESRRLRGCERASVFVGFSPRPKQDEALMGPEISWCEYHCTGYWTILYGEDKRGQGRAMYFGFSQPEDARAFERWRRERRDTRTAPEDFE